MPGPRAALQRGGGCSLAPAPPAGGRRPPRAPQPLYKSDPPPSVGVLSNTSPPDITLPARLDVETQTADMAQVASWVRGVERTGTRSVRIEGDDPPRNYRSFVPVTYITRVSEGR